MKYQYPRVSGCPKLAPQMSQRGQSAASTSPSTRSPGPASTSGMGMGMIHSVKPRDGSGRTPGQPAVPLPSLLPSLLPGLPTALLYHRRSPSILPLCLPVPILPTLPHPKVALPRLWYLGTFI